MKKGLLISGGCLIALAPLIVLAATIYTLLLPDIYCSQARIAIAEDMPMPNPFSDQEQWEAIATSNSCFLQTQFEIIQSPPILYEVINRLNLQQAWGRDGEKLPREVALKKLQNRLLIFQLRDPSLLYIRITSENPDEAAQVANELAETYRDYRYDEALKDARRKIDVIVGAMEQQQLRMEAAEEKVRQLRVELNIPESVNDGVVEPTPEKNRPIRRALNDVETERFIYNQLRSKHRQEITRGLLRNPVEIIDVAEPNRQPVGPNLFKNVVIALIAAGVCGFTGGVLLNLGLKKK